MLYLKDLTYRIAGRTLIDDASVTIATGQRVGLVGRNGTGKTTLFRLILGEVSLDGGAIALTGRGTVGTVAQEAPEGTQSLIETVLAADRERADLLAEADDEDLAPERVADVHNRLAEIDAHTAPARAAAILAGLGFGAAAQHRPLTDFSGGWRMRVALAAALFRKPDLLLLDEPTNHLDLEATLWLESHLAAYPGTLVVISHERRLLNRVVDSIIHLDAGKLVRYAGGYDRFEQTRRERLILLSKMQARQTEERRRIQAFVDRFRAQANKARQAQSRIKMLERMEPVASVIESRTARFTFPTPNPLPPPVITIENGAVGYTPGRPVLRDLNLRLDMDDRIGLLGANGNGKSTLVKLLARRLDAETGRVRRPDKLRVSYFAQHQIDELDPDRTAYQNLAAALPDKTESQVRAVLGTFGFDKENADTMADSLSGGEKARLLFALMSRTTPHLMLLDEPTNHLDVDAREALIQALNEFEGAVILVSHDPHLIEAVCDRLWLVEDGTVIPYDEDLSAYEKRLLERRRADNGRAKPAGPATDTKRHLRKKRADIRSQQAPLRKKVKDSERSLERLNKEKAGLEAKLADPSLYDGPSERQQALQIELATAERRIAETEEQWLHAHEKLESTKA